ncbi:Salicylate hydroxylase [Leucoagaricus sp. SymC.cos]|nr:Salicylate hydroxylase [Leucoagaricus sp. SymC.cos]
MTSVKDFRIAIVGGGMCGLACAVGLSLRGIHADVYEAASEFGQVGAGVGLGLNALKALYEIGILEPVLQKADTKKPTLRSFTFVSGYGEHELIYDYAKYSGQFGLGIYRPAFLEALLPLLIPDRLHLNKKCTQVKFMGTRAYGLVFEDGTQTETDLVLGADGIKSAIRAYITGDSPNLVFSNTVAYRGLVSHESLLKAGLKTRVNSMPVCWMGKNKHLITFPMQGTEMINVVMFSSNYSKSMGSQKEGPWVETVPRTGVKSLYDDMGNDVKIIMDHINSASKWHIHSVSPTLSSYVSGKVVLVGDSAHGMQPHLGAGVGQGFEDVYVLCRLLSHPKTNLSNLDLVLQIYDQLRPRRANMVLEASARAGRIFDSFGKPACGPEWAAAMVAGIWDPVWHHDLKKEVDEALRNLEKDPGFSYNKSHL